MTSPAGTAGAVGLQTLGFRTSLRDRRRVSTRARGPAFECSFPPTGGVDNSVHYFRDEKGLEVDLIVEHDGRWGAIEVKLSDAKADDGARNLKALERKVLSNPAAQNAAPAFLAVVVGKGSIAYTRDDGVAGDSHGGTWGVVVLRACRASFTENPFGKPDARG